MLARAFNNAFLSFEFGRTRLILPVLVIYSNVPTDTYIWKKDKWGILVGEGDVDQTGHTISIQVFAILISICKV